MQNMDFKCRKKQGNKKMKFKKIFLISITILLISLVSCKDQNENNYKGFSSIVKKKTHNKKKAIEEDNPSATIILYSQDVNIVAQGTEELLATGKVFISKQGRIIKITLD